MSRDGERLTRTGTGTATAPSGTDRPIETRPGNDLPATPSRRVTVVCNDPRMAAEYEAVVDVYRSVPEVDVSVVRGATVETLRSCFDARCFLHYIGHVDDGGFECSDGDLDAAGLDSVDVVAFLLNACRSDDQGRRLLDAGAAGGVVTSGDVVNSGADRVGRGIARHLSRGYPLGRALERAAGASIMGHRYAVVGNDRLTLTDPRRTVSELV